MGVEFRKGDDSEKDQFCLTTETMDKTLSLKTSEAYAHGVRRWHLGSRSKMGRRSRASSSSQQRKERREQDHTAEALSSQGSSSRSKRWKEDSWKPGSVTTRDSQNSQEQCTKERTNESKWKAAIKAFHEAGLIKETKAS